MLANAVKHAEAQIASGLSFRYEELPSLQSHPEIRETAKGVMTAEANLAAVRNSFADAQIELTNAEESAARGERNDEKLRQARERVQTFHSDVRIAETAVRLAKQQELEVLGRVTFACAGYLQVLHEAELRAFDGALEIACQHSVRLTELEDKSRQLIQDGPYTPPERRWARHLRRVSWRKEFSRGGYFDYWRKYFGLIRNH
jgi:hypothetical protein